MPRNGSRATRAEIRETLTNIKWEMSMPTEKNTHSLLSKIMIELESNRSGFIKKEEFEAAAQSQLRLLEAPTQKVKQTSDAPNQNV